MEIHRVYEDCIGYLGFRVVSGLGYPSAKLKSLEPSYDHGRVPILAGWGTQNHCGSAYLCRAGLPPPPFPAPALAGLRYQLLVDDVLTMKVLGYLAIQ